MIINLSPELKERVKAWSEGTNEPPEKLISGALMRYLEDWEDYTDALRICAEVDAGRMKVYSLEEVEEKLDALDLHSRRRVKECCIKFQM